MIKFLRNTFLVLAVVLFAVSLFPTGALAIVQEPQLNLSHVSCLGDGSLEIHFVLLNVPDGIIPSSLTYDYGTIQVGKNTGNAWHYSDYVISGYYDVTFASVFVNGIEISLHNPSEYAGDYQCSVSTPTPTATETSTVVFTPTVTSTLVFTPTVTSTIVVTEGTPQGTPVLFLPLTGAEKESPNTLTLLALGSLGMALVLTGINKKLVLDK